MSYMCLFISHNSNIDNGNNNSLAYFIDEDFTPRFKYLIWGSPYTYLISSPPPTYFSGPKPLHSSIVGCVKRCLLKIFKWNPPHP